MSLDVIITASVRFVCRVSGTCQVYLVRVEHIGPREPKRGSIIRLQCQEDERQRDGKTRSCGP